MVSEIALNCDACGGILTAEPNYVECWNDSQLQDDHEFSALEENRDLTICEVDGWMKIEHDLGRNLFVHESCFLDHDDILVRV